MRSYRVLPLAREQVAVRVASQVADAETAVRAARGWAWAQMHPGVPGDNVVAVQR